MRADGESVALSADFSKLDRKGVTWARRSRSTLARLPREGLEAGGAALWVLTPSLPLREASGYVNGDFIYAAASRRWQQEEGGEIANTQHTQHTTQAAPAEGKAVWYCTVRPVCRSHSPQVYSGSKTLRVALQSICESQKCSPGKSGLTPDFEGPPKLPPLVLAIS